MFYQVVLEKMFSQDWDITVVALVTVSTQHFSMVSIVYAFKQCGINKSVRNLFHLIIGYNIDFVDYHLVNIILSYIGFVIYKAHFCSERKTNPYNITRLLIDELYLITICLQRKNIKCLIIIKEKKTILLIGKEFFIKAYWF